MLDAAGGQKHRERRSLPFAGAFGQPCARRGARRGDVPIDRPSPSPPCVRVELPSPWPETLEYVREKGRRYAVARVGDIDANFASFSDHRRHPRGRHWT